MVGNAPASSQPYERFGVNIDNLLPDNCYTGTKASNNMLISKVSNMTSPLTGNPVANQFIITEKGQGWNGNFALRTTFQSYDSVIAVMTLWLPPAVPKQRIDIVLDEKYWDYSVTTGKYRNQFLGETKAQTLKSIKSGEYKLENLNK